MAAKKCMPARKSGVKKAPKAVSPQKQFAGFLAKYDRKIAATATKVLAKMRTLVPGAVELVYDNWNALVIGFGPSERAGDAPMSIALYPKWVTLFFLKGRRLPDPKRRLEGGGAIVRSVRLENGAATLDEPAVRALIAAAKKQAPVPYPPKGRLVIRSISPKQRPRRPA